MGKKKAYHDQCTVRRTFEREHGTLDMMTGESKIDRRETVTEECKTPIFDGRGHADGICTSCRSGWEHPKNKFASAEEKARATRS